MKKTLIIALTLLLGASVYAQKDTTTVLEVAGDKVSKTEFLKMYQKNNENNQGRIDREDLKDYLDLYINYKLKLKEARSLGLDTTKNYLEETDKYRKQLVEPYINDRTITDSLIEEAYNREKEFIRASHILITVPANATPSDTLLAYKKALMIREKALKITDFAALAMEYSDDPSAKGKDSTDGKPAIKGNGGDLGYFTSMTMIYPFENACYNMQKGEISQPVRTNFGYHIIKITDRIPAKFSTCDLKHVFISNQTHSPEECKALINEAYNKIKTLGIDSVAKMYSDDKYSANDHGWLKNQRPNNVPAEYIEKIQNMKEGDLSEPFETRFGWHIIRLVTLRPIQTLLEQKQTIANRISKDSRSYKTIESFAEKSKVEYGFKEYKNNLDAVKNIVTDSIFAGTWQIPKNFKGDKVLFTIGDENYTQQDFAQEIYTSQRKQTPEYVPTFIDKFYNTVVTNKVVEYADSKLEDKYPDLKANIDEFRDGVLIFAITDKMVWNKSLTDSIGLTNFYEQHKDKYMWQERADATIWSFDTTINLDKAEKIIKKATKKGLTNDDTKALLIKKFKIKEQENKYVNYYWKRFEKDDNKIIDNTIWNTEVSKDLNNKDIIKQYPKSATNKNAIIVMKSFVSPSIKTLDECKGIATSEYQSYLEDNWIKTLRGKYTYKVNYDVFDTIK